MIKFFKNQFVANTFSASFGSRKVEEIECNINTSHSESDKVCKNQLLNGQKFAFTNRIHNFQSTKKNIT